MSAERGHVTGIMSDEQFDELKTCDPQLAWHLSRNTVGELLVGKGPITIPHLDDADAYCAFGVIAKQKNKSGKGKKRTRSCLESCYRLVGTMGELSAPQTDTDPFRQDMERVEERRISQDFTYKCTRTRGGVKKSIGVRIRGAECRDVFVSERAGAIVLDADRLRHLGAADDAVYVIYELFVARLLEVTVTVGEQMLCERYSDTEEGRFVNTRPHIAVAFNLQRLPLDPEGRVLRCGDDGDQEQEEERRDLHRLPWLRSIRPPTEIPERKGKKKKTKGKDERQKRQLPSIPFESTP